MINNLSFAGKRVHIAGSISPETTKDVATYAHDLVQQIVQGILQGGGGIVVGAGKEPTVEGGPALVFDWSVLDAINNQIESGYFPEIMDDIRPIVVVLSEKGEAEIPNFRKKLWSGLLENGRVEVKRIMPGARSATMIRDLQVKYGDVLCVLGGGTGVEHLADEYKKSSKAVIPLDLPLGASREDGTGGAELLARESRANPLNFIRLQECDAGMEGAKLTKIATNQGKKPANVVAAGILDIIAKLAPPTAFYVRLLNSNHEAYEQVERFFRGVVDPVIEEKKLTRVDLGKDRMKSGFLNVEIFQRLHHSAVTIVDITGERPNCFIELGYALACKKSVLCTAEQGTSLPFDQSMIPCYFWKKDISNEKRKEDFRNFWSQYIDRSPLVS